MPRTDRIPTERIPAPNVRGKPAAPPKPKSTPSPSRPSPVTGNANALTRGQGRKVGLRRKMGVTPMPVPMPKSSASKSPSAPGTLVHPILRTGSAVTTPGAPVSSNGAPRPGVLGRGGSFAAPTPDRQPTPRPGPTRRSNGPTLRGRANALTRGKGKKIGLRSRGGAKG